MNLRSRLPVAKGDQRVASRGLLSASARRRLGALFIMAAFVMSVLLLTTSAADAQRRRKRNHKKKKPVVSVKKVKRKGGAKDQVFDFTGLTLGASVRTPQLLYFLDRASEELQRASLQRRSFVPEMVRSISEEGL